MSEDSELPVTSSGTFVESERAKRKIVRITRVSNGFIVFDDNHSIYSSENNFIAKNIEEVQTIINDYFA